MDMFRFAMLRLSALSPFLLFISFPLFSKIWRYFWKCVATTKVSLLRDMKDIDYEVLAPGLVVLRNALSIDSQLIIAEKIFEYGHMNRKWWEWTRVNKKDVCLLNNHRQGRGRIYDALRNFPGEETGGEEILRGVCKDSVSVACQLDNAMPDLESPTHLLVLYYTSARKLGWHRDNGAHDGQSLCPVVSVSIGNACDFLYRKELSDPVCKLRLESGDVLIFGGPSRHILHTVPVVHQDTCSTSLLGLHKRMLEFAPSAQQEQDERNPLQIPKSFRLNLTFRHAPELIGREKEERFYFFARSARKFLDLVRQFGVNKAQEISNETRLAKHPKKNNSEKRILSKKKSC